MRWLILLCSLLLLPSLCGCRTQSARISKVLPHYLDQQGRHTVNPSLFERDAYQAYLRAHPEEVGGVRFDVQWSSTVYYTEALLLRLELRGSRTPEELVIERGIERRPWYQRWTGIELDEESFAKLGEIVAWRATLWDGEEMLAEQRSFLW
ncbi:MAG: hypothetical protein RI897_1411 [Verrucomicrobiota bacterium]|jgi:hypothetical protein